MAFISDGTEVYILDRTGAITGTLTGFSNAGGLATDASGDLYIADEGVPYVGGYIWESRPPYAQVNQLFFDVDAYPLDVAIDSSNGIVAIPNGSTDNGDGPPNIVFLGGGMASAPGAFYPTYGAFDQQGDFVVGGVGGFGVVRHQEVRKNPSTIIPLTISNNLVSPAALQVTSSGDLAVLDSGASPPTIYTYAPPVGTNLGFPIDATPLDGAVGPYGFALTAGSEFALVSGGTYKNGAAWLYRYPSGGAPVKTVTLPAHFPALGAAVVPTEQFALH